MSSKEVSMTSNRIEQNGRQEYMSIKEVSMTSNRIEQNGRQEYIWPTLTNLLRINKQPIKFGAKA